MPTNHPVVVLTRFNLAIKDIFQKHVLPEDYCIWLDETYLTRRFELFETYTFPSFQNQTDHEYRWIVLFHKDTPNQFLERINRYKEKLHEFEPWFLDDTESARFADVVQDEFEKHYADSGVISVRVDNDDAVHDSFIECVKRELAGRKQTSLLTFVNGLQYDTASKRCMRYYSVNNHFIALYVSKEDGAGNVFSFEHQDIDKHISSEQKVIKKTKIPLWVEIVSETNCINEIWSRPSKVLVPFEVREEYPLLDLKWNNKQQWFRSIIMDLPIAFCKMFVDVVRLTLIWLKRYKYKQ